MGRITLPSVSDSPLGEQSLFSAFNTFPDSCFAPPINVRAALLLVSLISDLPCCFDLTALLCLHLLSAAESSAAHMHSSCKIMSSYFRMNLLAILNMCASLLNMYFCFLSFFFCLFVLLNWISGIEAEKVNVITHKLQLSRWHFSVFQLTVFGFWPLTSQIFGPLSTNQKVSESLICMVKYPWARY